MSSVGRVPQHSGSAAVMNGALSVRAHVTWISALLKGIRDLGSARWRLGTLPETSCCFVGLGKTSSALVGSDLTEFGYFGVWSQKYLDT